jgi:unsaturated chondroitin disaccharide hydrolase
MPEHTTAPANPTKSSPPAFSADALSYSLEKIRTTVSTGIVYPEYTQGNQWVGAVGGGWTGGHWTGLLWLAYLHTGDDALASAARLWTERLAPRQHDTTTHDLGFLFKLSFVLGAELSGDASLQAPALQAAHTLILRFNPQGRYLQAWGPLDGTAEERGRTIVDAMMNLALLYWAAGETGDQHLADVAAAHARTALKYQIRGDWSTAHVADFDPETGEFIKQATHQGYSATSCWARGQAWAIYGFAQCYQYTGDIDFLNASRSLATYFLNRLPIDKLPYWDFDSPALPDNVRDSSAASITAAALLLLAKIEPDPAKAEFWRAQAIVLLESLWQQCSSRNSIEPSILIHGTRHKPYGFMDQGLIYGDYYFVEALTRLLKPSGLPADF